MLPSNSPTPSANPSDRPPDAGRWRRFAVPRARLIFRGLEHCLALIGLACLIYHFGFDVSTMVSSSMSPTLKGTSVDNGDHVLTERISFWFREPRRWEVVTYMNDQGVRVMKRVVGLPGEAVSMKRGGPLEINGRGITQPPAIAHLEFLRYGNLQKEQPIPCGPGYYLLGDESRDSDDSRFNGPVARERIIGRSWLIVGPWKRIGWVNP